MIDAYFANRKYFNKFYAGKNGILGALREELIDISKESRSELKLLKHTPGGAFGSCRLKLKDFKSLKENFKEYMKFLKHMT